MLSFRLLSLLCTAGLVFSSTLQAAGKPQPNVVFITIDTLRADHLGCYGYKQIQTPNIDALAAHGVRFERAYAPVPVTLPAHTAIFTGTYPTLSGMHDFSGNKLSASQTTLASVLKEHGYATAAVIGSAVLDSRLASRSHALWRVHRHGRLGMARRRRSRVGRRAGWCAAE